MGTSLDGYVAGPDGTFGWAAPDDELHQFHNDAMRDVAAHVCGRRLYETMRFWDMAKESELGAVQQDWARIWKPLPKIVFSTTLTAPLLGNASLATDPLAETIEELRRTHPGRDIAIGGATLAAAATRIGLVDDFRLFVNPVVVGGGTPYLPGIEQQTDLELVETRTFGSRVVYLRYRRR